MPAGSVLALIPAVLLLALMVPMLAALRRPADVRLTLADDVLHVRFGGWDVVWLLQREIAVPVEQVRGVTVARLDQVPREGFRLPGAHLPGSIRAGIWRAGTNRDVWDVRRAEHVLWIELESAADYRRLILELPDPHATALDLRPTLGAFVPDPS